MKYNSLQDTSDRGFTVIVNTFDESSETLKLEITIRSAEFVKLFMD